MNPELLVNEAQIEGSTAPVNALPKRRVQSTGLREVALRAGVGIATASAVLNGSRSNTRVSAATRERVLAISKEMDYHPNALARGLSGRPTKTIGVLFGLERASIAVANPFAFAVFQGLIAGAASLGYNVMVFTEPWHNAARSSGVLRDGRTDGLVLIAVATDSDIVECLSKNGVSIVTVSSASEQYGVPSVDIDNRAGTKLVMDHLFGLGHTRIAHLAGDDNLSSSIQRRDAFLHEMEAAGNACSSEYVPSGSFEAASGYERSRRLLALPQRPTAIYAANDTLALSAIQAAHDCGLNVPDDLSVVGFDDVPLPGLLSPWLTTVRQPLGEIGQAAMEMLIHQLEGDSAEVGSRIFEPELIVRRSTSAPANLV